MRILFHTLFFLWGFSIQAQDIEFKPGTLFLTDGNNKQGLIAFDNGIDQVYFKTNPNDPPSRFTPRELLGFSYQGQEYASLPYQGNLLSFFQVRHQGNRFAVLEKQATDKVMVHILDNFRNEFRLCNKAGNDTVFLCPIVVTGGASPGYFAANGNYVSGANFSSFYVDTTRRYAIEKVIFLATENKLDFWSVEMSLCREGQAPEPVRKPSSEMEMWKLLRAFGFTSQERKPIIQHGLNRKLDLTKAADLIEALEVNYQ